MVIIDSSLHLGHDLGIASLVVVRLRFEDNRLWLLPFPKFIIDRDVKVARLLKRTRVCCDAPELFLGRSYFAFGESRGLLHIAMCY